MPLYEHVFLARQDISAQQVEALVQSFRELLEGRGGSVGKTEYWGLKSLSFRIKKNRKAHYALMNIDAPYDAVAELERQERLSTDVIRFLTVRVDEHDSQPSAMMRRADRDEREGGRGDRDRGDRDRGDRGGRGGRRDFRDRDFAPREPRVAPEGEDAGEGEETS
ncbi:MAG TPA: 30S ribosomal protein S6 [Methyloceanibacter sp.]|jgi:small subunit ribosomal protein S6|nr:30S ribosomal protein S6 [Methyloceanibacter sp.]